MSNINANLKFDEGIKKADEINIALTNLNNYLNNLQNIVDNLTWQGNNADKFRREIAEIRESWKEIYERNLLPVPKTIKSRIENYRRYENNE